MYVMMKANLTFYLMSPTTVIDFSFCLFSAFDFISFFCSNIWLQNVYYPDNTNQAFFSKKENAHSCFRFKFSYQAIERDGEREKGM